MRNSTHAVDYPSSMFKGRFRKPSLAMLLLGAVFLTVYFPAQASAQTAPPSTPAASASADSGGLEEIVVTSRLRKESAAQAPVVVTALSGFQLEQQGISTMQALAAAIPNVTLATNFLDDSIFIRGIGNSGSNVGFEQQAGLFIDGIYYGNGHWISGGYVDLDSAEVLEGPQGVYFGKNTIAGAFNMRTKNPTDTFEAGIKTGYEVFADERYVEAYLSGPLTDTLAARVVIHSDAMLGWAREDITGTRQPGSSDTLGRLTLTWNPTDNFDANFKAQTEQYDGNGPLDNGILVHCAGPNNTPSPLLRFGQGGTASCRLNTDISVPQYTHDGDSYVHLPSYSTALTMHWRQEYGELTSITGLNRYNYESLGNDNFTTYDGIDGYNTDRNEQISTELRYQTKLDFPVNFLGGVYYQSAGFENNNAANVFPQALQGAEYTFYENHHQHDISKSVFGEVQWTITDQLELDVAGRFTDEAKTTTYYMEQVANYAPAQAAYGPAGVLLVPPKLENYNFSPQAILTWKPTSDLMMYVAYKTGFLSGGYNLNTQATPRTNLASQLFGPEKVKGGEIGTKFYLFDRRVQINADAYYYDYNGLQEQVFNPTLIAYIVQNAAESRDKGVELSGTGKLGGGFSASGTVAFNKSNYLNYVTSCLAGSIGPCNYPQANGTLGANFAGVPTSMAPLWAGTAQLGYETPVGDEAVLRTSVSAHLSDKYIVGDVYKASGWAKFDANVSVDWGKWTAAVIGRNMTGVITCSVAKNRPLASAAQELSCLIDRGAEARFEVSYRY